MGYSLAVSKEPGKYSEFLQSKWQEAVMTGQRYCFGPFLFDAERQVLLRQGNSVQLGQRGTALLGKLLSAGGKSVSKAELMDAAWPNEHVEESNLTVQMSALRKCLGQAPTGEEWIITVQRNGYQFHLDVLPTREAGNGAAPATRLAVLPFVNLSTDNEQAFFADGLTEDIITELSHIEGLVISSTHGTATANHLHADDGQIAAQLGVRYLVSGSVRRDHSHLRITAQLVDTDANVLVWAERFDREVSDLFELQDDLTRHITSAITTAVTAQTGGGM